MKFKKVNKNWKVDLYGPGRHKIKQAMAEGCHDNLRKIVSQFFLSDNV